MQDYSKMTPAELRAKFRTGELVLPTAGLCPGYIQGNLVILAPLLRGRLFAVYEAESKALSHSGGL